MAKRVVLLLLVVIMALIIVLPATAEQDMPGEPWNIPTPGEGEHRIPPGWSQVNPGEGGTLTPGYER